MGHLLIHSPNYSPKFIKHIHTAKQKHIYSINSVKIKKESKIANAHLKNQKEVEGSLTNMS